MPSKHSNLVADRAADVIVALINSRPASPSRAEIAAIIAGNMGSSPVRDVATVAQVVEALGGTKSAAEWADVGIPAISNWIEHQHVPPGWHYRIERELRARGYEVDPAVFGLQK